MTQPSPHITNVETAHWPWEWYPSGPRSLAVHAEKCGWSVRVGFSRGYVPGAKEGTWDLRDCIGVWVDGFHRRAGAFWERNPEAEFSARKLESGVKPGEIPSGMQWSTTGTIIMAGKGRAFPYASLTDLREWLTLSGKVTPEWYTSIQSWVLAHEENTRRRTKAAPTRTREREHS